MGLLSTIKDTGKKAGVAMRQAFRARLTALNVASPVQLGQLSALAGETLQAVELFQQFGFTSSPPNNTQCVVLPLSGKTSHSIIVATENGSFRLAVQQGEVCLYNQWGAYIKLLKEKIIEVDCDQFILKAKDSVEIKTTKFTLNSSNKVDITTAALTEKASASAGYMSPALSFNSTNGGRATATMNADIKQQGSIESSGDHIAGGISLTGHTHTGDSGGSTGAPL